MSIKSVTLYHIAVPLKSKIKHASHERLTSDNLVVGVTLADGTLGFGEGVPRSYVTGETIESTFEALSRFDIDRAMGSPADYAEVVEKAAALELPETRDDPRGMNGNAARCALELAILDAYGKHFGESLGTVIRMAKVAGLLHKDRPSKVRYSGAIMAATPSKERRAAIKMWIYGFHQIKIKVGVDGQDDPRRLKGLRRILGKRVDLRLDANEAWPACEVVERLRPLLAYYPTAIEQPVKHAEADALAGIRGEIDLAVMLDESLCGYPDAVHAIEHQTADIFNVRLSKCGGLFPTLKIMALAQRSGIGLQLGCHPGETGLLSAAGRHVASRLEGLRYVEGSYDRHVLAANIIKEDVTFGYGGWAPLLTGPGLGVSVDPEALDKLTVARRELAHG